MNKCGIGFKFLASVGKKKSRFVEVLIIEWSSTGEHFKAEIRDGLTITFEWHNWTDYRFVELLGGPVSAPKTTAQSDCEVNNEQLLDDASVEKLSFEAANAIDNLVEYFPIEKQQEIRDTIFKLRSISELNSRCKFGLMSDLYEDMISEFVSIWPKLMGKRSHMGMGVSVGSLTGRASGLAPKDGFLSIVEFVGPKADSKDESKTDSKDEPVKVDINANLNDVSPIQSHFRNMMVDVKDYIGEPQIMYDTKMPFNTPTTSKTIENGLGDIGVYSKSTPDNNENIDSD